MDSLAFCRQRTGGSILNPSNEPNQPQSASEVTTGRHKRRIPPMWILILLAIICIILATIRGTEVLEDHGFANVGTLVLGSIAVVTLAVWFLFFSGYGLRPRLGVFALCVTAVTAFAVLFRLETVNGELKPIFVYRFGQRFAEKVPIPPFGDAAGAERASVDLRTTTEDDFPQFLGPSRSDSVERPRLGCNWTDRTPELVWRHEIGAGWSAFSVVNGHAVTMEQRGEREMVTCYNVKTGRLEWSYSTVARFEKFEAGVGPRSTPTIDEGMVFALGALGHLVCLDGRQGKRCWERDLLEEGGVTIEEEAATVPWGRSNSPLIVGNRVIVPLGGRKDGNLVTLAAYNKRDGKLLWKGGNRQISYSSPCLAQLADVEQVLCVNEDTMSGHEVDTGKTLWEHPWKGHTNMDPNVSQAVPLSSDRVFVSKAYGGGSMLLQLAAGASGDFSTQVLWKNSKLLKTKFTNVAIRGNFAYGLSDGILECVDWTNGDRQWKDGRYGHGQLLLVNDLLLILSEKGEVLLVGADPTHPNKVLGSFQAIEGLTWNNFALSGPYLLVRNAEEAACYKLPLEE